MKEVTLYGGTIDSCLKNLREMAAADESGEVLKAVDSFTRGDMETCYVSGAQSMEQLQEGFEGTFGQAIGSLKHGFLVRRKGWNGKGMFLFMRPWDSLNDGFIIDTVKSLPWSFKEWVKAHPNADDWVLVEVRKHYQDKGN